MSNFTHFSAALLFVIVAFCPALIVASELGAAWGVFATVCSFVTYNTARSDGIAIGRLIESKKGVARE